MKLQLHTELTANQLKAANYILRAYRLTEERAPASLGSIMRSINPDMEIHRFAQIMSVLSMTIDDVSETE